VALSATADARSRPNGFSMTSRVQPRERFQGEREIEHPVPRKLALPLDRVEAIPELREARGLVVRDRLEEQRARAEPGELLRGARLLALQRLEREPPEAGVVHRLAGDPEHDARVRELPLRAKLEQDRQELSLHQVPRRAEDDEDVRVRRGLGHRYGSDFTSCPPNLFRIIERSFSVNGSASRDRRRCCRARVITGAGMLSSSASVTVHRPSPESTT